MSTGTRAPDENATSLAGTLLWPTVAALLALGVLVALGTWQLSRLAWKEDLIAKIAARTRAAPVDIEHIMRAVERGEDIEFAHVRVRGSFRNGETRFLFAPEGGETGWHVYVPLETPGGAVVWINRGWIHQKMRQAQPAQDGDAEIVLRGLVRHSGEKGLFTPVNEPARNVWYWRDIAGLTRSAPSLYAPAVLPFSIDAEVSGDAPRPDQPRPGVTRIKLPNRHLEYALTWYGLALALIGVYAIFALQRVRSVGGASRSDVASEKREIG